MRIECIPLAGSSDFDLILQLAVTTNITQINTIINTITSTTINDKTKT